MLRALIAEDDPSAAELIQTFLHQTGKVQVVGVASSGAEAQQMLRDLRVDVAFLDVQMPDRTGVEVAKALLAEELLPQVVFVTGHDEYAAQAYDLEATDYIVKPTDPAEFSRRLSRAVDRVVHALDQQAPDLTELRDKLGALTSRVEDLSGGSGATASRRLPIKDYDQGTVRLIDPEDIVYLVRRGDRVVVHTAEEEFPTYYTVDQMEQRLSTLGFVRINPGALVNIECVNHLIPNGDGSYDLVLGDKDETVLTASRRRSRALMEYLKPQ